MFYSLLLVKGRIYMEKNTRNGCFELIPEPGVIKYYRRSYSKRIPRGRIEGIDRVPLPRIF
jgi:hypothetical protein